MRCLKIEKGKGFFCTEEDEWKEIDAITKEDIMTLLNLILDENSNCEMDTYEDEKLSNSAHNVIYKSLFNNFSEVAKNKNRFIDETKNLYKEAIEKYTEKE